MKDKRIDTYIEKSAALAKPILNHLRDLVHKACPDATDTFSYLSAMLNFLILQE